MSILDRMLARGLATWGATGAGGMVLAGEGETKEPPGLTPRGKRKIDFNSLKPWLERLSKTTVKSWGFLWVSFIFSSVNTVFIQHFYKHKTHSSLLPLALQWMSSQVYQITLFLVLEACCVFLFYISRNISLCKWYSNWSMLLSTLELCNIMWSEKNNVVRADI